ncbi:hypothetical protein [Nocardioides acrostichi]|uniref:DUF1440 domain-containing protein n=1 Tax=Nocardioides acrostichi TaxID=2784339 RepID=A0A930Y8Q4_9ACTN|nr:hypothetical protein [Nocardioides acrostichi]MBF4163311.1 hypothetical protein [Nocardioides acrostichi]
MTPRDLLTLAVRGLAAGVAGTAAMTATTALERRVRRPLDHAVDYDASPHVAEAVGTVLHRPARGRTEREAYFLLAHWGYGPAVAVGHEALRRRLGPAASAGVFFVGCQAMAMTLFPTLGGTRAPWRWPGDVVASSLAQHVVYAGVVAGTSRALARRAGGASAIAGRAGRRRPRGRARHWPRP